MVAGLGAVALIAGCAPPGVDPSRAAPQVLSAPATLQPDETPQGFDLDALIAAARKEPGITVYDQSGTVVKLAENFAEKYGVRARGVKVELGAIEKVVREHESGNVVADVVVNEDLATYAIELLDQGVLVNWVPGDVRDDIAEDERYPLLVHQGTFGWVYNNAVYDRCPVSNIWQLTEPEWSGRVAMADPLSNPKYMTWFNELSLRDDQALRDLYRERYGTELNTDQPSAGHEWVRRFAQNRPQLTKTDEEVSEAVGAPGQDAPSIGPVSMAKFRNVKGKGYAMAICGGLKPWALKAFPSAVAIAAKSKSPNTAKLYIHYLFTEEGFAPLAADGKVSTSRTVPLPEDPSNVRDFIGQTEPVDPRYLVSDYETRSTWADFWRVSRR
jgi:iron(III) transport system substrate-binding protein